MHRMALTRTLMVRVTRVPFSPPDAPFMFSCAYEAAMYQDELLINPEMRQLIGGTVYNFVKRWLRREIQSGRERKEKHTARQFAGP